MTQFNRRIRVTVGSGPSVIVEDARIDFSIERNLSGEPNPGTIKLFNLAAGTRYKIKNEFDVVRLEAGYGDEFGIIYQGEIRHVRHAKEGADVITVIEAGDGEQAINGAAANVTLEKPSPKEIADYLVGTMKGVVLGEAKGLDGPAMTRDLVMSGPSSRYLDDLARSERLLWSVQNGKLEISPEKEGFSTVALLSPNTGMVGSPEETEDGVILDALISPNLAPNRIIRVVSDFIDAPERRTDRGAGRFRVSKASYRGTNRDGPFIVTLEAERLDGGTV